MPGERELPIRAEKEGEPRSAGRMGSRYCGSGGTTLNLRQRLSSSESESEKALERERLIRDCEKTENREEEGGTKRKEKKREERGGCRHETNSQRHEKEEDRG